MTPGEVMHPCDLACCDTKFEWIGAPNSVVGNTHGLSNSVQKISSRVHIVFCLGNSIWTLLARCQPFLQGEDGCSSHSTSFYSHRRKWQHFDYDLSALLR
jgi:hypothetical protein